MAKSEQTEAQIRYNYSKHGSSFAVIQDVRHLMCKGALSRYHHLSKAQTLQLSFIPPEKTRSHRSS